MDLRNFGVSEDSPIDEPRDSKEIVDLNDQGLIENHVPLYSANVHWELEQTRGGLVELDQRKMLFDYREFLHCVAQGLPFLVEVGLLHGEVVRSEIEELDARRMGPPD